MAKTEDRGLGLWSKGDSEAAIADRVARREWKREHAELKASGRLSKGRLRSDFESDGTAPSLPDFADAYERFKELRATLPPGSQLDLYNFKVQSQHGEDGIMLEIFTRLGVVGGSAVEIAAGHNGGNSGALVGCLGFRALWVEADPVYSAIARKSFAEFPVTVDSDFVTVENVVPLLRNYAFDSGLDYLGIDIDGNDLWIWRALEEIKPRVVVCEYNPIFGPVESVTIPYRSDFDRKRRLPNGHWAEPKGVYGASLVALERYARSIGYRLVCTSKEGSNAFFLRGDVLPDIASVDSADAFRTSAKRTKNRMIERQAQIGFYEWLEDIGATVVQIQEDGTPTRL